MALELSSVLPNSDRLLLFYFISLLGEEAYAARVWSLRTTFRSQLAFRHVGPRMGTQTISLSSRPLYSRSHLARPQWRFSWYLFRETCGINYQDHQSPQGFNIPHVLFITIESNVVDQKSESTEGCFEGCVLCPIAIPSFLFREEQDPGFNSRHTWFSFTATPLYCLIQDVYVPFVLQIWGPSTNSISEPRVYVENYFLST